jgi:hypothetical protein
MIERTDKAVDFSAGSRLLETWQRSHEATLRAPATPKDIVSFEERHHVKLPPDLRGYFACTDGFDQKKDYQDARGFNFWPLKKLRRVSEFEDGRFGFPGDSWYFLFCDYLDFSWGYAISLKPGKNDIILVGTRDGRPRHVANSFEEFVDAYLRDDDKLYA